MSKACTNHGLRCEGGPLHMQRLILDCYKSGTVTFTLNGQTGRYIYARHEEYFKVGSYLKWQSQQPDTTISAQATA